MPTIQLLIFGPVALAIAYSIAVIIWLNRQPVGNEAMGRIASAIKIGAQTYLIKQYQVIAVVALITAAILSLFLGQIMAFGFLIGACASALTGYLGMHVAVRANVRTAEAARTGIAPALAIAFRGGSVVGFTIVAIGLFSLALFYQIIGDVQPLVGLGFGASFIALFARVGGGIFTKAADVGADLVGKVETGIPEDDPRNPAVIADNVGDNVGDVAGMGADLFESYVNSMIAVMLLSVTAFVFPLLLAGIGIIASMLGVIFVRTNNPKRLITAMNSGLIAASVFFTIGAYFLTITLLGPDSIPIFWSVLVGLVAGILIGFITNYFTSSSYAPTRRIAAAAQTGAGTNLIAGLAVGMISTALPVFIVVAGILVTYALANVYGVAIAAVGMLATLGISLATDTYGPIADNAAGIAEMARLGPETRERAEALDAVGNTTAAIGKGFAIGSAGLTTLALLVSFFQVAGITTANLEEPAVIAGLFLGALLPFVFSALTLRAVGEAAMQIVHEVRRQFREIVGLKEGAGQPDYAQAVSIATGAALRSMTLPALLAVIAPVAVGFGFGAQGAEALAGLLVGSLVSGFLLAIFMANAGGAWDNAKKYIEAGNLGGKGSNAHKAAVIGDTVGDPLKDTAGPSINILIKIVSVIALIIAPLL